MQFINKIKTNSFMKNFLYLFSASLVAQVITLITSPILTRIYTPEDFGVFSFYLAMISLLIVFVTGSYEYSINTLDDDKNSLEMIKVIAIVTLIMVGIYAIISEFIITFYLQTPSFFNREFNLYVILALVVTGLLNGLSYYLNRLKKFPLISKSKIYNSMTNNLLSISLGTLGFNYIGFLLSHIAANIVVLILYFRKSALRNTLFKEKINIKVLFLLAKENKEYPQFNSLSLFFNNLSLQAPVLIFMKFFSESIVGFYSLTVRAIGMPLSLISATLSQVFLSEISELNRENKPFVRILIKTLLLMMCVGIVPLLVILLFGPRLFEFVFGTEWILAGEISRIIIFSYYFKFIISPLSVVFYVKKKVKMLSKIQFVRSISTLLVLVYSSLNYDFTTVVLLYTIHECAFYTLYFVFILKISK